MSVDELERCLIDSCFPEEDMAELERAGSYRLSFWISLLRAYIGKCFRQSIRPMTRGFIITSYCHRNLIWSICLVGGGGAKFLIHHCFLVWIHAVANQFSLAFRQILRFCVGVFVDSVDLLWFYILHLNCVIEVAENDLILEKLHNFYLQNDRLMAIYLQVWAEKTLQPFSPNLKNLLWEWSYIGWFKMYVAHFVRQT